MPLLPEVAVLGATDRTSTASGFAIKSTLSCSTALRTATLPACQVDHMLVRVAMQMHSCDPGAASQPYTTVIQAGSNTQHTTKGTE